MTCTDHNRCPGHVLRAAVLHHTLRALLRDRHRREGTRVTAGAVALATAARAVIGAEAVTHEDEAFVGRDRLYFYEYHY